MKNILLILFCIILLFCFGCGISSAVENETAVSPTAIPLAAKTPMPAHTPPEATPVKTTAPDPTPEPIPEPVRIHVLAAGDLLCLNSQLSAARKNGQYQFDYCFSQIMQKVSAADLAIANLETLVAPSYSYTGPKPETEYTETLKEDGTTELVPVAKSGNTKMNAPEEYLSAVAGCGFDVLTTANNHIYDYKSEGIVETIQKLEQYSVYHTGAYALPEEKTPLIIDVQGINIVVLAYTEILNNRPRSENAFMVDTYSEEKVTQDIAAVNEAGADFVIVCIHWGAEHTHRQSSSQERHAEFIANAGADIILGSHSHCTQPFDSIETDRGSIPVIYSLGNFLSSMAESMHKDGVMVNLYIEKEFEKQTTSLINLNYTPTFCTSTDAGRYVVCPADSQSIEQSPIASSLENSRQRTIKILSDTVAAPE